MPQPVAVTPAPAPINPPTKAPIVPTPPAAATPAAAPVAEQTFEVTVAGKPTQLTRKQIEKYAGKGAFADGLIRQAKETLAATTKREAELAERESIWDDDEKLEAELLKRGKLDALARKRLEVKLREQEMTPEQREKAAAEDRAATAEKKLEAVEKEQEAQRVAALSQQLSAHVNDVLGDAWERIGFNRGDADAFEATYIVAREFRKLGLLPKSIDGWTPALADRICEEAKSRIETGFKELEGAVLKGLKGKALQERLGMHVVNEIRRHDLETIRGGGIKKAAPIAAAAPVAAPSEYLSVEQAREIMRKAGK